MRVVRCHYANGDTVTTSINGTDEEIRAYFVGKDINIGDGAGGDLISRCESVEFLDSDIPIVSIYTCEQAVKDGVLIHPYPKRWPWLLISIGVHQDCSKMDAGRNYDQCLVPLCMDAIMAAKAAQEKQRKGKTVSLPLILEGTIAGRVYVAPNDRGGLTICKPEED